MVKNICLLSSGLILIFTGAMVSAKTLREMAQNSSLLLVLSDRVSSSDSEVEKRSCGMSHEQISARSQKLKAQIDQKIESLTDNDYKILEKRISTCELDCTCDIYALAFEKKEKPNEILNKKAAEVTIVQREKCAKEIKNLCARAKL